MVSENGLVRGLCPSDLGYVLESRSGTGQERAIAIERGLGQQDQHVGRLQWSLKNVVPSRAPHSCLPRFDALAPAMEAVLKAPIRGWVTSNSNFNAVEDGFQM